MTGWQQHDSGAARLVLVGPVLSRVLSPDALQPLGLHDAPQLAIDGGIRFAVNPILWAGDGDSGTAPANAPVLQKHGQDETDLGFCLSGIKEWKWEELHLFGFLGARRDHELANFGEIHAAIKARREFRRAVFYGETFEPEVYCFREGSHSLDIHGVFSLMVLSGAEAGIGGACDYPAAHVYLDPLSGRGVSNIGRGRVDFRCGKPFMVLVQAQQG